MSTDLSAILLTVLTYLLPGFLAAWIFYGLTSHPKPSQFERVVQALIFTFIIQTLIPPIQWSLEYLGQFVPLRSWDDGAEALASLCLAVVFGTTLAHLTNRDALHGWLRSKGFTSRTAHPSEWYYVLSKKVTYIVLHLNDGRRLYGWPKEWPMEPDRGQFYIMLPSWINENGEQVDLPELDGILINATDVKWIEFLENHEDQHVTSETASAQRFESAAAKITAQRSGERQSSTVERKAETSA